MPTNDLEQPILDALFAWEAVVNKNMGDGDPEKERAKTSIAARRVAVRIMSSAGATMADIKAAVHEYLVASNAAKAAADQFARENAKNAAAMLNWQRAYMALTLGIFIIGGIGLWVQYHAPAPVYNIQPAPVTVQIVQVPNAPTATVPNPPALPPPAPSETPTP